MSRPVFVDSRRALLGSLIDYAGLFPPASLSLEEAVAEYRRARSGAHAWMLGTFVVTASRLDDLAGLLVRTMSHGEEPWRLSVILDGDTARAAATAGSFSAVMEPAVEIRKVEARLPESIAAAPATAATAGEARRIFEAAGSVSPGAMPFLEIPVTSGWRRGLRETVATVARLRDESGRNVGAKLRCGGPAPTEVPDTEAVTRFMISCRDERLVFKATAGLHHPIRHYDAELGTARHGFLNLLVAAALAESGADEATITAVVESEEPTAFSVGAAGVSWRGHRADAAAVALIRSERFSAYGSCSFDEPVAALESLGILPVAQP